MLSDLEYIALLDQALEVVSGFERAVDEFCEASRKKREGWDG